MTQKDKKKKETTPIGIDVNSESEKKKMMATKKAMNAYSKALSDKIRGKKE